MLKRKTLLFLAILLIVAAQFGVQEAIAFSDYNEDPLKSLTINGWTVSLSIGDEVDGYWQWTYDISNPKGTASGLNFAAILVPDCYTDPKIDITESTGFTDYFAVGEGEPHGFGRNNMQARVAKGTPASSTIWSFYANTEKMTTSSILVDVRGKTGELAFEMAVPGCLPEPDDITQSTEQFSYVNDAGQTYTVTVFKDQYGNIVKIERTGPDPVTGEITTVDITENGVQINQINVKLPDGTIEPFTQVPDGTVSKTDDDSTCGYWYAGMFWNFCY